MSLSLSELQAHIAQALRGKERSIPCDTFLQSTPALSAEARITIYRNSLTSALQQTLSRTFPICEQIVGVDFFRAMSFRYLQEIPSKSPDIDDYGDQFADFVHKFPPVVHLPYLAEMARTEWAWHTALRAPEESGLTLEQLQALDPSHYADLIVKRSASSTLLACQFPILKIWKLHQSDLERTADVHLSEGGVKLWIWRKNNTVYMDSLDEIEWFLGCQLAQPCTLGELLEQGFQRDAPHRIHAKLWNFVKNTCVLLQTL